ncbi:MAG: hypothetical protein ACLQFR_28795 [Streptosporangiaceae bacterium]
MDATLAIGGNLQPAGRTIRVGNRGAPGPTMVGVPSATGTHPAAIAAGRAVTGPHRLAIAAGPAAGRAVTGPHRLAIAPGKAARHAAEHALVATALLDAPMHAQARPQEAAIATAGILRTGHQPMSRPVSTLPS